MKENIYGDDYYLSVLSEIDEWINQYIISRFKF